MLRVIRLVTLVGVAGLSAGTAVARTWPASPERPAPNAGRPAPNAEPQAPSAGRRAQSLYARALELDKRGNFTAALSLLWEASGLSPDDPDIQNRLGEALDRLGALDAAIDAFRRALAHRPVFAKAEKNLILTLVKAGRGPEATTRARAIVAGAPADPEAHFTLGLAQSEHDIAGAIQSFERAISLDPRHTLARYNLALILKREDRLSEAIGQLARVIEIEPTPEAHYTTGVIFFHQGQLEAAARAAREAIAIAPDYAEAHHTLGAVLKASRDWTGAAAALRRALEIRPDLWGAHHALAQVLEQAGDARGARKHLQEAERLRVRAQAEQQAGVLTAVGTGKLERGDLEGALDNLRRATTVFEDYAPAHYQLGRVLQNLGRRTESRMAFERAHRLNPSLVPPGDPR